jgi:hypothetical protein
MARILVAGLVFALVAAATVWWLFVKPGALGSMTTADAVNPDVFADGIGIYVLDNNRYSLLVWKTKILGPQGGAPQEQDMMTAARDARRVGKGVRFFSYGIDFSKWQVVPPYGMAFCLVRDPKTVDGVFPIRIKIVDRNNGPIYELVPPPLIDNLAAGRTPYLFWTINFQYSCADGWAFKF